LVFSDTFTGVIYIFNPCTPLSAKTLSIFLPSVTGPIETPAGLAFSDVGMVYSTTFVA
jgi:hypothetical protein